MEDFNIDQLISDIKDSAKRVEMKRDRVRRLKKIIAIQDELERFLKVEDSFVGKLYEDLEDLKAAL